MAYTIKLSNNNILIPGGLPDGTIDGPGSLVRHSSLTLIGRDYPGYGQFLNENFIYLLENFANKTGSSPTNPIKGQLWYNYELGQMLVWSGNSWKIPAAAQNAPFSSPPGILSNDAVVGDLWFDNTNNQLRVYAGAAGGWILVGPPATKLEGDTGVQPSIIQQSFTNANKICLSFVVNGVTYAVFSTEAFQSNLPGFASIRAGLNFSTTAGLGLNTQTTAATPNTLVQRDGTGGITGAVITGSSGTFSGTVQAAAFVSTSGAFTGNLVGNVKIGTTEINGSQVNADAINAVNGITGVLQTVAQPYVTQLGNLGQLKVSGALGIPSKMYGKVLYNDVEIATVGGASASSWIDNQPIGGNIASSGIFKILRADQNFTPLYPSSCDIGNVAYKWGSAYINTVYASTYESTGSATANLLVANIIQKGVAASKFGNIGSLNNRFGNVFVANVNADEYVTLRNDSYYSLVQNITGALNRVVVNGTWRGVGTADNVGPYSGNITLTLPQDINSGASPTFKGGNFTEIPIATALDYNYHDFKGGTGVTVTGGSAITGSTSRRLKLGEEVTIAIAQDLSSTASPSFGSLTLTSKLTVPSITKSGSNGTGDIGQSDNKFKDVWAINFQGTASGAVYSDLAERYAADDVYEPGTVVCIGGTHEITKELREASDDVFGVISTDPGFKLNTEAGTDQTHPYVALSGRVPVKVIGAGLKGQRLISAGQGLARVAFPHEIRSFNVIGRLLVDKLGQEVELAEAVVYIR